MTTPAASTLESRRTSRWTSISVTESKYALGFRRVRTATGHLTDTRGDVAVYIPGSITSFPSPFVDSGGGFWQPASHLIAPPPRLPSRLPLPPHPPPPLPPLP